MYGKGLFGRYGIPGGPYYVDKDCVTCKGSGIAYAEHVAHVCHDCEGTGTRRDYAPTWLILLWSFAALMLVIAALAVMVPHV